MKNKTLLAFLLAASAVAFADDAVDQVSDVVTEEADSSTQDAAVSDSESDAQDGVTDKVAAHIASAATKKSDEKDMNGNCPACPECPSCPACGFANDSEGEVDGSEDAPTTIFEDIARWFSGVFTDAKNYVSSKQIFAQDKKERASAKDDSPKTEGQDDASQASDSAPVVESSEVDSSASNDSAVDEDSDDDA